jgi:DNA replication protein DnaC
MEPLNDILGRVTPRRQPTTNHPTYQGTFSPSSRPVQPPQQPSVRQQPPEPMARQRLKYPYGSGAQQPPDHATIDPRRPQDGSVVSRQTGQDHREPGRYASPLQRSENRLPNQRPPQQQAGRMPSRVAQQGLPVAQPPQAIQPLLPSAASKMGHYHRADDSTAHYYGDGIEEWDEQEEDVDDEGMCYGDWESSQLESFYKKPELELVPNPRTQSPVSLHQTPPTRPTRDLRNLYADTHVPVSIPTSALPLPQPTMHTQDIQQYQRVTQPLNPHIISELGREHALKVPDVQRSGGGKIMLSKPTSGHVSQIQQLPQSSSTALMPARNICPRCQGAGYLRANVPFGDPHFGKAIACECKEAERRAKRRQQLREMSNLDALRDQNFQTFNSRVPGVQQAYSAAQAFAENHAGWLLLIGPNGCGKTHLAAAVANQALDTGAVVLFEPVPDLLDHLRAAFAPSSNEVYDQLFAKMREAEVLILDDLGAQQSSPWANEKLFQLLNYRYNMGMPTVITANLKGVQGVDERIRSRLTDTALVLTIHMDRAYDYRPKRPKRY